MVIVAGLADQEHVARHRRLPVRARVGDEVSNGLRLRHAVAEGIVHLLDVHQADAQPTLAAVFDERLQRVGERRGRDDEFVGALVDGTKRVGPRGADLVWFTGSIGRKRQITAIGQWVGERYADGAVVLDPSHLPVVRDVAEDEKPAHAAPGWPLEKSAAGPQPADRVVRHDEPVERRIDTQHIRIREVRRRLAEVARWIADDRRRRHPLREQRIAGERRTGNRANRFDHPAPRNLVCLHRRVF